MDIPSTDVIRHWCGWGADEDFGDNSTVYTPTTEEVRLDYAPAKTFPADAEEQFDRWLAEVKAQAWEQGCAIGWATAWHGLEHPARNPYRHGVGSGNLNSQSTAETPAYLNQQGEEQ